MHDDPVLQSLLENLGATSTLRVRIEKFISEEDVYLASLKNEVSLLRGVVASLVTAFSWMPEDAALSPLHGLGERLAPIIARIGAARPRFPSVDLEGIPGLIPLPELEPEGSAASASRSPSRRSSLLSPSPASAAPPESPSSVPPIDSISVPGPSKDVAGPA